jgi:hypothetical protein
MERSRFIFTKKDVDTADEYDSLLRMNYKPLPTSHTKLGFEHTQLFREGDIAIFHKVHLDPHYDAGFETVVISRHNGYEIAGNVVEPAECYPSPEMWGTRGWTFTNLLAARTKFAKLVKGDLPDADEATPEKDEAPIADLTRSVKCSVKDLLIPVGEFKTQQLADHNSVTYNDARAFIQTNLGRKIKEIGPDQTHKGKGKKPILFSAMS